MNIFNQQDFISKLFSFILEDAATIGISLLLLFLASRFMMRMANQFVNEDRRRFNLKKSIRYVTAIISIIWLILLYSNYTNDSDNFLLFILGIFLAGVAFTLRDIFSNVVGWMMVASHNGYQSGDRIEIGTMRGDVIDVGMLRTTIAEIGEWEEHGEHSTGRLISFPNSRILQESVVNYNRGFETIWNELAVLVTFESSWDKAESIMEEIAMEEYEQNSEKFMTMMKRVKRDFMVTYNYLTPKVYVTVVDSGVKLTLRHMVEVRKRRTANDMIFRKILTAFKQEPSIEFAYPTTRFYKAGERAE